MKHYLVNTPLILQDENGEDVRVERGEVIELSDTQYAEVAAHVTLIAGQPETPTQNSPDNSQANQAETQTQSEQVGETSEQKQSENSQENQTETPAETADKPTKRVSKTKESAA